MRATLVRVIDRVRALFRSSELDADFHQELAAHIEMLTDDNVRRGLTREEARRSALMTIGGPTALAQRHRETRSFQPIEAFVQDCRFAFRLMAKDRWFSAAAIAAIALGIGANTLGFTIINAAFLRGFGFDDGDRLYSVSWRATSGRRSALSLADLEDWRSESHSFDALAGFSFGAINISDDSAMPEQSQGSWVTANHFSVLRQQPLIGRAFGPGDDQRGADPVVIIGYDIWTNRYRSDPNILGRSLRVNGKPSTIVGVMPARMKFPENSEMWVALVPTDAQLARTARQLGVFGRLAATASRESATTELNGIAERIIAAYPDTSKDLAGARVETFVERFMGGAARPMFLTVMGAVMFVLLIACANVANLLLSRSIYRAREIAVRFSMGATRARIVGQLLVESVLLSGLGGVVGLVLASFGVKAFDRAVQLSDPPYWLVFTIDYRVVAYVAAICVATGVVFGLAPALHVSRSNNHETLKDGGRGTVGNRRARSFSGGMVVAELTLTVVLLCGAGLMIRSFAALYAVDTGVQVDGLMRMRLQLPPSTYPSAEDRYRFFQQLEPRLAAIPGVTGVAVTTGVPPLDGEERLLEVDDPSRSVDARPLFVSTVIITPQYFDVLGVPLERGRAFSTSDGASGSEAVIVNEQLAARFFPGQDPIGRRIRFVRREDDDDSQAPDPSWRTIVGISGRLLQGSPQDAYRNAVVYLPFRQETPRTSSLLVRSALAPATVMAGVRREVQGIDRDQPVFTIQTVAELVKEEQRVYQIFAVLFAVLAVIALVLSSVGLYAVMAYAVTQRTQEIGVRMAVGAQRWQVSWIFLARGLRQLGAGLALGIPIAIGLSHLARFRLVEVEPTDPMTLVGLSVVLTAVSLAACLLPVRRAAHVDPVVALRAE